MPCHGKGIHVLQRDAMPHSPAWQAAAWHWGLTSADAFNTLHSALRGVCDPPQQQRHAISCVHTVILPAALCAVCRSLSQATGRQKAWQRQPVSYGLCHPSRLALSSTQRRFTNGVVHSVASSARVYACAWPCREGKEKAVWGLNWAAMWKQCATRSNCQYMASCHPNRASPPCQLQQPTPGRLQRLQKRVRPHGAPPSRALQRRGSAPPAAADRWQSTPAAASGWWVVCEPAQVPQLPCLALPLKKLKRPSATPRRTEKPSAASDSGLVRSTNAASPICDKHLRKGWARWAAAGACYQIRRVGSGRRWSQMPPNPAQLLTSDMLEHRSASSQWHGAAAAHVVLGEHR